MLINLSTIDFSSVSSGSSSNIQEEKTVNMLLTDNSIDILPDEGYDGMAKVSVSHGPVQETVEKTITENGSHRITPSEGYDAMFQCVVDVNVPTITPAGELNIISNGKYDITDKASVNVNVPQTAPTGQFNGHVDVNGLKQLGWTDDDIADFQANVWWYDWQDEDYKVLDSDINHDISVGYKDQPGIRYAKQQDLAGSINETYSGDINLLAVPKSNFTNTTFASDTFNNCNNLRYVSMPSTVRTNFTFTNCSSLYSAPKVILGQGTYDGCSSLKTIDCSGVGPTASRIFNNCKNLEFVPELDLSNLPSNDYSYAHTMFYGCEKLKSVKLRNISNATQFAQVFWNCLNLTSIIVDGVEGKFNLPKVYADGVEGLFYHCGIRNIDISFSNRVTNLRNFCNQCSNLQNIIIGDTSKVSEMPQIFYNCGSLKSVVGIDFSGLTSYPYSAFRFDTNLEHIIVNGSISFSWTEDGFSVSNKLDYESIKSILTAMTKCTNPETSKTMRFKSTMQDQNGELQTLVDDCVNNKGWTITGLTITE